MDTDKYIGIKHYFNESSFEKCDCLGLCKLFYKEHGWSPVWDDGKPITVDWHDKEPYRLARWLEKNFKATKNPNDLKYGDIVFMNVNDELHLGIFVENDMLLTMEVPVKYGVSSSTLYRKEFWLPVFVRGFMRE